MPPGGGSLWVYFVSRTLNCEAMDQTHDHRVGQTVDSISVTVADDQPAALVGRLKYQVEYLRRSWWRGRFGG